MKVNECKAICACVGSDRVTYQLTRRKLRERPTWIIRSQAFKGVRRTKGVVPTHYPPPYLVGSDNVNIQEIAKRYKTADSISALAREIGMHRGTLWNLMKKHNIPTRRTGYKSPKNVPIPKGEEHYNWKGGTYVTSGYVLEYAPEHPEAFRRKGYVHQHRLVMERKLKRYLTSDEIVHHINGDSKDNRIDNLELHSRSTHISLHKKTALRDSNGRFTC